MKTRVVLLGVIAAVATAAFAVDTEPLVRDAFAFDGLAGYLGWEALAVTDGAASTDVIGGETGPDGKPVLRLTGTAKSCTFKTVRFALVEGEPYRLSAEVRTKGLGKTAGDLTLGGLKVAIPGETDGKWVRVAKEGNLPKGARGRHPLAFAIRNLAAGASIDISVPKIEPLSEKAIAGSKTDGVVAPMIPRIVPVEPLLSAVDARTGLIRFRANVPTNGCMIVATVDGQPLGPIAEGRHEVVVKLVETATGKVKVENTYPFLAKIPQPEKKVGRRLNNFVVEVLNAELKDGAYAFENPRRGWVFIGFDRPSETAQAFLTGIDGPVITYRAGEPSETTRYLEPGAYTLTVKGAAGGRLRIHLIKPTLVGFFNPWREGSFRNGKLDERFGFDFMRRVAFKSMSDVNIRYQPFYHRGSSPERRAWVTEQLRLRGKRPLAVSACSPGERDSRARLASQRRLFCDRQTFRDGFPVSYDENGLLMSMRDLNCCGEAAWEMANLLDPRPIYMDWFSIQGETIKNFDPVVAVMSANVNSGLGTGILMSETYIGIHADEARFERSIENLKANQRALGSMMPEVGRRIAHTLCGFQQIGSWTSHLVPQVDRKVAMERLVRRLATDPDFAEVGGITFSVPSCGEELLRWGVALIHHYAIEGRTDSISEAKGWKYFPETVADGDFLKGLAAWKAVPAEDGSLTATSRVGFARSVQKRNCASHEEGDFFAVLKRSAKGPNRLSQTISNLVPGQRYVLEFACSNLDDVEKPVADANLDLAIRAEVTGMPFDDFYTVEDVTGEPGKRGRVRSLRYVFRATAAEGELVFTDWASARDPGGKPGRRLTLNSVAVTPYFEPAPGELDAPMPELHLRKVGEDVKYVAHQGEERLAVNHSIAAYRISAAHGCDYLKLDVRETKDGYVVTQHDGTLKAVYGTNLVIAASTLAELRQPMRSRGEFPDQHVCTLGEALDVAKAMPGVWLDFKHFTRPFADKVIAQVVAADIPEERILVGTWSKPALKYMAERYPRTFRVAHTYVRGAEGAWLTNSGDRGDKTPYATLEEVADAIIARCRRDGIQGVNMPAGLDQKFATPDWMVKRLKDAGLFVSMWFVKDFRQGARYREAGADAFVMMDKAWAGGKTDDARPVCGVCAWCGTVDEVKAAVAKKAEMIGFSAKDGPALKDVLAALDSDRTWVWCDVGGDRERALALARDLAGDPIRRRQTILAGTVPVLSELKKAGFRNQPRGEHPDVAPTNRCEFYSAQAAQVGAGFLAVGPGFDNSRLHRQMKRSVYFGPAAERDVGRLQAEGFDFIVLRSVKGE